VDPVVLVSVLVVFAAEVAFVGRLLLIRGWHRSPEGVMLVVKDLAILSIVALALLSIFAPDWAHRTDVRRAVWLAVATGFAWKTVLFYRRQAQGRRMRKNDTNRYAEEALMSGTQYGKAEGAGTLAHDSKWGNIFNGAAAAAVTAGIAYLNGLDFSHGPAWLVALGGPAVGLAVGFLTSKVLPRFKRS
jgi:hypothetical protein